MPEPTDIDNFDAKLRDARSHRYDCLDYDDQQCQGKLVLLAWVGGSRFKDDPKCTIREYDTWWFWLAARSDEPRLTTLKFSVECKSRCTCFAGPWAKARHKWKGDLHIPVRYDKSHTPKVGLEKESICRESKAKSPLDLLEAHLELDLPGQTTHRESDLACTVHLE